MADARRTSVYVDGFNLYYGAVRGTPYKWLDLNALCHRLLPLNEIHRIRYFTAKVQPRPGDVNVAARQQTYLRALRTLPNVSIHFGTFRQNVVKMKLADSIPGQPRYADVLRTEEKGSDVNIASYMLMDCFRGDFDVAVVISNDTDLITPVQMVREMGCPVGLLNPHRQPARDLMSVASFYKQIRKGVLADSQFPPQLTDKRGTITKPKGW